MRAFIAFDFDDQLRRALGELQSRLKPRCPGLKWVRPEQIHLTIKFLGDMEDSQIVPISQALDDLASRVKPFEIGVEGLGVFPPGGRVNVVWVGIVDAVGALEACHALCEELVGPLGFPPEGRKFSGHLTIARNKDPRASGKVREVIMVERTPRIGAQEIDHVTLYESVLAAQGPTYRALSRHAFRA